MGAFAIGLAIAYFRNLQDLPATRAVTAIPEQS
jgi:hypothetical protein